MQPKELPFQSSEFYSFRFLGGTNNVYTFITAYNVVYEVRFKPTGYLFEDAPFAPHVFEFSLLLLQKPEAAVKITTDVIIPNTVVVIFLHFFQRQLENICIYICDSSDFKQHVRKKKFDRWFAEYNNGDYLKIDEKLVDADGTEFPVSLILRQDNPFKTLVFEAFTGLVAKIKDEK